MLTRLTVRKKLLAIAGLVVVAMLAIGLFVRTTVTRLAATSAHLSEVSLPVLQELAAIDEQVALVTANVRGLSVPWLVDRRAELEAALRQGLGELRSSEQRYDALPLSPAEREAWTAIKPKLDEWVKAVELVAPLLVAAAEGGEAAGPLAQMKRTAFVAQMQRAHQPVEEGMQALAAAGGKAVEAEAERARTQAAGAVTALVVLILLAGAVTVGTMVLVSAGITRSLTALVAEAAKVSGAVGEGRLEVRGDPASTAPEFRPIIEGLNATADAFAQPIHVTAQYVARIGQGDIPPKITDHYEGDFNLIKRSLNDCIDAVNALVSDAATLAKAGVEGRLATRADASRHQGDFRKVVQGVNDTLDAVINPLNVAARYVDQISKGNIPPRITDAYAGDFNTIKENLNRCIDAVNRLVAEAGALAQAGVEGRLATRADASKHEGDFRKIVEGVNKTLDVVIGPLNVAARYVDEISRGAIPQKITDAYAGDFNTIKENLNTCIDAVNRLVADAGTLVDAAVAGRLTTRADASKHQGDFKKIVEGVNQTLDAVLAPITEAAGVLERLSQRDLRARVNGSYQGDHAKIKDSLNATGEALEEALSQVAAAVEQVSSASQQIASSSQAVASGASEQAASLEETGSSLESVSAMTRQAADNASQANTLATTASAAATEGAAVVAQMQTAMVKIRASAEGTSQIIKDINDIAFQTNLLALNAAVEAARAGEAGRGFAVVAEEVRSLALRAKEAAMKTEELIKESVRQAGEGEVTSRLVAGKLGEIVTGISKVSGIVSEIAAAAKEQSSGIDQVNQAVGEMDKVTQQNAASAEESSSAASELNGQAEELAAMVGAFQLTRAVAQGSVRRPAARAAAAAGRAASLPSTGRTPAAFPMDDEARLREF